jgi:hypothetical protein
VAVAKVAAAASTLAVNVYFLYRYEPTMTANAKKFCILPTSSDVTIADLNRTQRGCLEKCCWIHLTL